MSKFKCSPLSFYHVISPERKWLPQVFLGRAVPSCQFFWPCFSSWGTGSPPQLRSATTAQQLLACDGTHFVWNGWPLEMTMRRIEQQSVAKTQTQQNIVKSPKTIKNGRTWEKNCWPCSRTACKGISRLSLKTRNGCREGSETHHVILLNTPNGHGDINRTTDPKHKTSLSWGTKRHFCLAVNPCYRVVMSRACMRFFFLNLHWKFPMASSQDNGPLC